MAFSSNITARGFRGIPIFIVPSVFFIAIALSLFSRDYSPTSLAHAISGYSSNLRNLGVNHHLHTPFDRPGFELPIAGGLPLRILPLGASTTKGQLSSDDNGYRRPLRERLVALGNPVNFVGTERDGNMTDNDHEAQNGARLDLMYHRIVGNQIVNKTKPNLILIGLGTNDVMQDYELGAFYKRYHHFVNSLLSMSPQATIVVSTLPVVTEHKVWNHPGTRIPKVNDQIRKLVKIMQEEGKPVVLAELYGPLAYQPESLQYDGSHPNDAGYALVGSLLFNAIVEADAKGFLQRAVPIKGIAEDGDVERLPNGTDISQWMKAEKEKQVKMAMAVERELNRMKEELENFYARVKTGQIEAIPHDPPKDPPGVGMVDESSTTETNPK